MRFFKHGTFMNTMKIITSYLCNPSCLQFISYNLIGTVSPQPAMLILNKPQICVNLQLFDLKTYPFKLSFRNLFILKTKCVFKVNFTLFKWISYAFPYFDTKIADSIFFKYKKILFLIGSFLYCETQFLLSKVS